MTSSEVRNGATPHANIIDADSTVNANTSNKTSSDITNDHNASEDSANKEAELEDLDPATVLIAGAGPVGLLLSVVLSFHGVKSVLLERNLTTTRWPKMDLTNARSMELFRKLGLADALRSKGVPSHIPSTVLISSGLGRPRAITSWLHPSVDEYRKRIASHNDGSMPLEPYQRISQAIFEKWLKEQVDRDTNIDARFGWKVYSVVEDVIAEGGHIVRVEAVNAETGSKKCFKTRWLVGCDGASSTVRRSLGIELDGGPVPGYVLLVHFKSRDLSRLQSQGQFWHIFFLGEGGLGSAIIAQDEIDTWTVHLQLPLGADSSQIDSHDAIYTSLGGLGEKYEIKVDEILVRSTYRPSIAVASMYRSMQGQVFLAGDAAHQNIPTGGYGMNLGLMDAFDLGWKLVSVIQGSGGEGLLQSYETDRRPVALMSIERSGVHMATHINVGALLQPDARLVDADTELGREIRDRVHQHYQTYDGENTDLGVEMGYRYKSAICIAEESAAATEPKWLPSRYTPTTWPGSRAPHVFLTDGSAIFDHFAKGFTLIDFEEYDHDYSARMLLTAAKARSVSLTHVQLPGEENARRIWEGRRLVIIRPDGHVSWRGNAVTAPVAAMNIVATISGLEVSEGVAATQQRLRETEQGRIDDTTFSMIIKEKQSATYELKKMGEFQQ